jgi:transposase
MKKAKSYLANIVFSDEHIASINDHSTNRMWVQQNGGRVLTRERKRVNNVDHVLVWAAIGVGYKGPMIIFPKEEIDHETGRHKAFRLTAKTYIRRCLSKIAPAVRGRVYMHDGATAHTAHNVQNYVLGKGFEVLQNWPPYSPDLNPIEEVWAELNRRVSNRHPTTHEELVHYVKQEWDGMPQSLIDSYCNSFRKKLKRCVEKKGQC